MHPWVRFFHKKRTVKIIFSRRAEVRMHVSSSLPFLQQPVPGTGLLLHQPAQAGFFSPSRRWRCMMKITPSETVDWDAVTRVRRESRYPEKPIIEPAPPSGFFLFRDTLPAMVAQWAAVIAVGAAVAMLAGCGPSDVQTARAVAADLGGAQAQAQADAQLGEANVQLRAENTQLRNQVDHLSAAMAKGRPAHISPADWAASVKAVSIAQGSGQ